EPCPLDVLKPSRNLRSHEAHLQRRFQDQHQKIHRFRQGDNFYLAGNPEDEFNPQQEEGSRSIPLAGKEGKATSLS
ncbi:hypothetical protein Tsubulata_021839, partial [Turnera subulata]